METQTTKPVISIPKDGVQAIIQIGECNSIYDLLKQEYLIIEDHDDRGLGDGIRKCGLPGGGIEKDETSTIAILRELREEVAIDIKPGSLKKMGSFTKLRPGGFSNMNYLFYAKLDYRPQKKTNDPDEVSKVHIFTFREIFYLARFGRFHEGSIRLIFHFLNGVRGGSLNEPAHFHGYTF